MVRSFHVSSYLGLQRDMSPVASIKFIRGIQSYSMNADISEKRQNWNCSILGVILGSTISFNGIAAPNNEKTSMNKDGSLP